MTNRKIKTNSGFIALMSAIIISIVLLLMITNLSLTGFYGRFNVLDFELKEHSSALAEACVDTALLNLTTNGAYSPMNEVVTVDSDNCTIVSISGIPKIIYVQADYKNYITKLEVEVDTDMSIVDWREIP